MKTTRRMFAGLYAAAALPAATKDPVLARAMESLTAAIPRAESDPARPVWHFRPPANWNNDPNGTIFYQGWHHLFYQLNPYGAVWGHMHWGHARSRDLVNWEHLPIALGPSEEKGEEHIFSGGAILADDGRPRIFYTSIGKRDPEQWMAIPADDDLIEWEKHPRNPILTLKIHGDHQVADWRDPFLFREGGKTYMVCGGNAYNRMRGGGGEVQLYEATRGDLSEWKYRGVVFRERNAELVNIECPNLFKVGARWVLLDSPHKPCEYFVGDLDLDRARFTPDAHGVLDPGTSYASNISYDDKGRCILWLWGRTATDPVKGWNSCMAMPRILSIDAAGFLRQQPAPEFASLRGVVETVAATDLGEKTAVIARGDTMEIEAVLRSQSATALGLRVRNLEIAWNPRDGVLSAGKAQKLVGREQPLRLRVFLDRRVLEIYANDGAAAIFTTVDAGDPKVETLARGGGARLESCRVWPLRPARLSLERFKV